MISPLQAGFPAGLLGQPFTADGKAVGNGLGEDCRRVCPGVNAGSNGPSGKAADAARASWLGYGSLKRERVSSLYHATEPRRVLRIKHILYAFGVFMSISNRTKELSCLTSNPCFSNLARV